MACQVNTEKKNTVFSNESECLQIKKVRNGWPSKFKMTDGNSNKHSLIQEHFFQNKMNLFELKRTIWDLGDKKVNKAFRSRK